MTIKSYYCLTILYFSYEIIYILLSPILEGHLKGIFDEGIFIVLPFSLIYIYGMRLDRLSTKFVIFNTVLCLFTFIIIAILLIYGEGHFVQTQNFKYPPRIYYFSYSLFSIHIIYLIALKYEKLFKNNFISWLSSNSLWIYLWHIYALYIIKYIHILDNDNSFNFIIKFMFIMLFSISFTYLQSCRVSSCLSKSNNLFLKDLSSYLK